MGGHLVLVGYMGSGKSTVGPRVAEQLGLPFVELDDRIEVMTGQTIDQVFASQGETRFREFESAALRQALAGPPAVIATGGGVPMDDDNWRRVLDGNVVVHLDADPEDLLARIGMGAGRPLASGGSPDEVRGRLLKILQSRNTRYSEAPFRVDSTGQRPEATAAAVVAIGRAQGVGGVAAAGDNGG